ncbi:MAG: FAD-dependent oxidoreductase [Pseudomonadota bacterium]
MSETPADIVLIGGGHSHVAVLADWARRGLPARRAVLVTPDPKLRYSGMVPGWISGEHTCEEGLVDLAGLARAAGVEIILDRCLAIDPEARSILTLESGVLSFTNASIDVGGVGQAARVLGDDPRLIDVRPIDTFVDRIDTELAQRADGPLRIAIIGGGAAGFELAFALRNAAGLHEAPKVTLVIGSTGPLPGHRRNAAHKALQEARRQSITVIEGDADLSSGQLMVEGKVHEPQDQIIAAIGSGAPDWPRMGGLEVDMEGFIMVDAHQRAIGYPHIFAAGDCARRVDEQVAHSGVHAVHTGPVLAANLRAVLTGKPPRQSYRPRRANLYLISTGNGEAIASYGPLALQGRWVAWLKAWIDKRWIASYARLSGGA